jgi:hypothetical protein
MRVISCHARFGENMTAFPLGDRPPPRPIDDTKHSAYRRYLNEVIAKRLGLYGPKT